MSDAARHHGAPGLDLDWITPQLAVGGCFPDAAAPMLAGALGISAVVDLRDEACDDPALLARHGMALLHLPTPDHCGVSPAMLDRGVDFTIERVARGARALVHCREGIGRSVTLALCVLAALQPERWGRDPIGAMTLIKDARWLASPSPEQFEAWAAWLERRDLPRPDFDAFVAVAYRRPRLG